MKKILLFSTVILLIHLCFAGNFTPGNIVIVRVGDGSAAPSNKSTPVFLDEYTTAGAWVQSIPLPTAINGSNHALTLSGTAITEGALTLSPNNEYLSFVGFDTSAGYANVSTGVTKRTVGIVGANGVVNTSTGFNAGIAYVLDNFRSAVTTDGSGFWCSGDGTGTSGGTWYLPFGAFTSSPVQVNSAIASTRVVNIFNGQLYFTANSGGGTAVPGLYSLGLDTPNTAGQTATILPGTTSVDSVASPFAFYFTHLGPGTANNVVYICDDETAAPLGGIYKFSLVSGSWVSNGNVPNINGLRGMAAYTTCSSVHMFVSAQAGILSFSDTTGYNQTIAGTFTVLAQAPVNTALRGIAFAPGTTPPAPLAASVASSSNITCHGLTNGSITLNVSGGTSYSYAWSDGSAISENRNNLGAGTYTVTVSSSGCSVTASASLSQPSAITVSPVVTNVSCNGGSNGAITLNPTGGTGPYRWNPASLANLSSGTYDITVTDTNSCSLTTSVQVTQPNAIAIADTFTNLPCSGGGNTGSVNIGVTGGTAGYAYSWSNDSTSKDIANLAAGTYTVTVTDSKSCTATLTAILSHSGNLTNNPIIGEISCYGLSNGSVEAVPSGGSAPYHYAWSGSSDTTHQITGLAAGNYTVTISDQGGCTLISSVAVNQPGQLTAVVTGANVTCYGAANGIINVVAGGGTIPYAYTGTGNNFAPGIYDVSVHDANGCSVSAQDTITQPDSLSLQLSVTNATAFGANDGSIALTVTGGSHGYNYDWSNGGATQNDSGLVAGAYCIIVTDPHSCVDSACATVTQPTGIEENEWMEKLSAYSGNGFLLIDVILKNEMHCSVQLFDITGNLIISSKPVSTPHLNFQWPDAGMASGCYLVRIITDEGQMSRKVVIVK